MDLAIPSRTAILVAAARAFASRDPDQMVRNPDVLADLLIGPDELALISEHPLSRAMALPYAEAFDDAASVFFAWGMLLRTRFIDEALIRAVGHGVTQVVILGAGFDSRAYRFRDLLRECRVVEIDAGSTQELKRRRLNEIGCEVPENVSYYAADFNREELPDVLHRAGVRQGQKSFYIWEGVCMYLPADTVRRTLTAINHYSGAGSSVLLDYANARLFEMAPSAPQSGVDVFQTWGEPWLFGVPNPDGQDFFRELGFNPGTPVSVMNAALVRRFTSRSDGSVYGSHIIQRMPEERRASTPPELYWLAELISGVRPPL